jgi:hypothetical protein
MPTGAPERCRAPRSCLRGLRHAAALMRRAGFPSRAFQYLAQGSDGRALGGIGAQPISAPLESVVDPRQALGHVGEHKRIVLEIKRRIAAVDGPMVIRTDEHQI